MEAIKHINRIFSNSKSTLVCDRDLMSIEVGASPAQTIVEVLLVTLLVCDWNVRAWTFLESMLLLLFFHTVCTLNRV